MIASLCKNKGLQRKLIYTSEMFYPPAIISLLLKLARTIHLILLTIYWVHRKLTGKSSKMFSGLIQKRSWRSWGFPHSITLRPTPNVKEETVLQRLLPWVREQKNSGKREPLMKVTQVPMCLLLPVLNKCVSASTALHCDRRIAELLQVKPVFP